MKNNFTKDWFSQHIPSWTRHLEIFKGKPIKALEIGSFEGRSSLWLMENILTNPKSKLTCVDIWENYPESDSLGFQVVGSFERFQDNLEEYLNRIKTIKGSSFEEVPKLKDTFDFIYVDGDHTEVGCWTDAVNSFEKLNIGGIMIFDDYKWVDREGTELHPKGAIDRFMNDYKDKITVEEIGYQVVVKKCKP